MTAPDASADVVTPLRLHLAGLEHAETPVGRSASPLHTFGVRMRPPTFDVDGWSLLQDHPTIAFGDGGSLKSYLALYAAGRLAQQGTRVLLLDWELDGEDHVDRFRRLFGDDLPLVHYLRCDAPLVSEQRLIAREVQRLGIQYLVFDSIGAATDGPPEAADQALRYGRTVRQIGVRGSLHIAHVNKSESGDQKPFGSVFWHNWARMTWFIRRESPTLDRIRLVNRKVNLTGFQPDVGFEFGFNGDHTSVSRIDLNEHETPVGPKSLSIRHRIVALIQAGGGQALTVPAIAEALDEGGDGRPRDPAPPEVVRHPPYRRRGAGDTEGGMTARTVSGVSGYFVRTDTHPLRGVQSVRCPGSGSRFLSFTSCCHWRGRLRSSLPQSDPFRRRTCTATLP